MSCEDCEIAQDSTLMKGVAYYRWKNANIAVIGCDAHLKEVFDALNKAQSIGEEEI